MQKKRLRHQRVRTSVRKLTSERFQLSGWLAGRGTYLWFGESDLVRPDLTTDHGRVFGILHGQRLYRLAKAIVRHYEADAPKAWKA